MTIRAAIYARVSTDKQGDNYSIGSQLDHCRQYASERGYTVVAEYRDTHTGAELKREKLDELREAARRGEFEAVITINMDRLSRGGLVHQLLIDDEFKRNGAPFEYVFEQFEDSPEGEFQKQVRAILAQFERAKFMQRSKWGRDAYIAAGHVVRGRVDKYGYRYANKAEGKSTWEIIENEAIIVRLIYQWYTTGDETGQRLTQWPIAKKLTALAIPTRYDTDIKEIARSHKKRPVGSWSPIVISRILSDETYAGTHWYGKSHRVKDEKTGKKRLLKAPKSEWKAVSIPAIVSRELWEASRRQAGQNEKNATRNAKYPFLLRGMLRCSDCKGSFSGTHHHNRPVYKCKGTHPEKWAEPFPRMCKGELRADVVESLLWDTIAELLKQPELIMKVIRERQTEFKPQLELLRGQLESVQREIIKIEGQRSRLIDLYLMEGSTLSKDILGQRDAELSASLAAFTTEKAHLERQLSSTDIPENAGQEVQKVCEQIRVGIDHFTQANKRNVLELLNVSITVQRGETRKHDTLLIAGYLPTSTVTIPGIIAHQTSTYLMFNLPFVFEVPISPIGAEKEGR